MATWMGIGSGAGIDASILDARPQPAMPRSAKRARARRDMQDALVALMREKPLAAITVTDVARRARVSRSTFYRNYDSFDDVVRDYLDRLRTEALSAEAEDTAAAGGARPGQDISLARLTSHFAFYRERHQAVLALCDNGFGAAFQQVADEFAESAAGDMPATSVERYRLYFLSGAMCNVMLQWMRAGCPEPPSELAFAVMRFLEQPVISP